MQTKHFVNNAETLVKAALKSCCILQPELSLDIERKILYAGQHTSTTNQANQVSIISGGGSGHEPSFTGFVGAGFLTACVAGNIFASPSSTQVLKAIESVDGSKGVLVTVMNYTGDVLNFGVAVEKAKTRNPDLNVRMLIVGDDVGVSREKLGKVGRRGIAGTVLVHKITGALAAGGCSLDEVMRVGRLVTDNLASIGVSLNRVHVPGRSLEEGSVDSLGSDEVELGMGIHNEAGSARKSGADASLPSLVQEMLRRLLGRSNTAWSPWQSIPKEVVLLVNNLGGLSVLELGAVVTEISEQLQKDYQLTPARIFAGTFMTSLNGPGFSMSLLNLVDTGTDQSLLDLLDFETMVSGWHAIQKSTDTKKRNIATDFKVSRPHALEIEQRSERRQNMKIITRRLQSGLHAVVASEPEITKYDDIVGDGDCGTTLKRGAEGILKSLATSIPVTIIDLLLQITDVVESTMDGTSGALYAIFLNSLTHYFQLHLKTKDVDLKIWTEALDSSLSALSTYTPARTGDRTLMDALIPFVATLKNTERLETAVKAAEEGALNTKFMHPALGRTVYVGSEAKWMGKIPDPGAWGLYRFLEGLVKD